MKKRVFGWLLIILAALVVLYLAASWYMGKASHDRLESFVTQINQDFADQWSDDSKAPEIEIIDYKRGLLSSLVTYQINYYHNRTESETALLIDKLSHGPFPVDALVQGDFTPMIAYSNIKPMHGGAMQAWFDLMAADKTPWYLINRYYFNGVVKSDLELKPFAATERQLEFLGGQLHADYDPESTQFNLTGNISGLSYLEPSSDTLLKLQDIDVDVLTIRGAKRELQSHQQLKLSRLEASWPDGLAISFDKPDFSIDSSHSDNVSNSKLSYDLGQAAVGDTSLGNLQAVLAINNINTGVLQEIVDTFSDANTDDLFFGEDPQLDNKLYGLFKELFAESPAISLENLNWQTDKSSSNIQSSLSFKPVMADSGGVGTLIEQSVDEFQLDLDLFKPMIMDVLKVQFDDRTVQLFSMLFDHYMGKLKRLGLIDIQDHNIKGNLRYANGLITVNGNVMSPQEFQERIGSIISP